MARRTLHILANCTDRKRLAPPAELRLRRYAAAPLKERFYAWASAIKAQPPLISARDLYIGPHWATVRDVEHEATVAGFDAVHLWVLSAGYGLVGADSRLAGYSSTFSSGAPDSVARSRDGDRSTALVEWWHLLSTVRRPSDRPRTIAALARNDAKANFVVIASPPYVEAISADIREAIDAVDDSDRFLVITSRSPRDVSMTGNFIRSSEALLPRVGGARTTLHARVALDLIASTRNADLSAASARARFSRYSRLAPPQVRPKRRECTDDAVLDFIARKVGRDPAATHTRLLREFRSRGMACEQSRFRTLFKHVQRRS